MEIASMSLLKTWTFIHNKASMTANAQIIKS